jgi:hypothetical protein
MTLLAKKKTELQLPCLSFLRRYLIRSRRSSPWLLAQKLAMVLVSSSGQTDGSMGSALLTSPLACSLLYQIGECSVLKKL